MPSPENAPTDPSAGPDAGSPTSPGAQMCKPKALAGRFVETEVKCGDPANVAAFGVNIAENAATSFTIKRLRDSAAAATATATMTEQATGSTPWRPKKPAGTNPGEAFTFQVSADGVSAASGNSFTFKEFPDYGPDTKTYACTSGVFGWTGKHDIKHGADKVMVTVKIKLINRLGAKPDPGVALPAIGDPVSDADKTAMKTDVEAKYAGKFKMKRHACGFGVACTCVKPIQIVVEFVEADAHHDVNLFQGPGRANASNWTRVKTRDNSWAHETGHLLGFYDEYTGGAVGAAPRWKPNEPANVMNVGLGVPPEYAWDFRDWFAEKTGESWDVS